MAKQPSIQGGQVKSVPAYYEGQNANGTPDHYKSADDANKLKASGRARSIHRGTAILIRDVRPTPRHHTDSVKSGWKVVGQTPKKKASFPGFPRWGSVGKKSR